MALAEFCVVLKKVDDKLLVFCQFWLVGFSLRFKYQISNIDIQISWNIFSALSEPDLNFPECSVRYRTSLNVLRD